MLDPALPLPTVPIIQLRFAQTPIYDSPLNSILVGPPGPPSSNSGVDPSGALLVTNRLSELALSPDAQTDARANLGLSVIDGGTFS